MKYIGILSMDSWHLANGIHQPSLWTTGIWSTIEEVAINLGNECERLHYTDDKGDIINSQYLLDKWTRLQEKKYNDCLRIEVFDYKCEGRIQIERG